MAQNEYADVERRRLALERLIESVEAGEIDAVEDLSPEEVSLLLSHARTGESLEDLLDRLRQPAHERD